MILLFVYAISDRSVWLLSLFTSFPLYGVRVHSYQYPGNQDMGSSIISAGQLVVNISDITLAQGCELSGQIKC